jgi:hypothetical protein
MVNEGFTFTQWRDTDEGKKLLHEQGLEMRRLEEEVMGQLYDLRKADPEAYIKEFRRRTDPMARKHQMAISMAEQRYTMKQVMAEVKSKYGDLEL